MDKIAYVNGSFVPMAEAKVSILDRGFLFADGIYEVAAVLDGKLIDNASHLARLQRSVGEIALDLPETIERIQEIQKELIARNNLASGLVYLEVTRGADKGRDFADRALQARQMRGIVDQLAVQHCGNLVDAVREQKAAVQYRDFGL